MKKLKTIFIAVLAALRLGACVTDGAYPGGAGSAGHSHLSD